MEYQKQELVGKMHRDYQKPEEISKAIIALTKKYEQTTMSNADEKKII